jgi:hypothetical protein
MMGAFIAAVGQSTKTQTLDAVQQAVQTARNGLQGAAPGLAFITSTVDHSAQDVFNAVREQLPNVPIHGITTSLGVLGSRGVTMGSAGAVGVLLMGQSDNVRYGVGSADLGEDAKQAGQRAAERIARANPGQKPVVLLVNAAPGHEEDVLEGIATVFPDVPAYGGSAADHAVAGQWSVFTNEGVLQNGVSIAAVFGSVALGGAFVTPYKPRSEQAHVHRGTDRQIASLDGRPAAQVLGEWVGAPIAAQVAHGGNILAQTSLRPLGVRYQSARGEHFIAVHPAVIREDGSVDVFARMREGQTVCSMEGTQEGLIDALPGLYQSALQNGGLSRDQVRAAVLIYCAGCAGAVGEKLDEGLRKHWGKEMENIALLGLCTFGEQGFVPGVGNLHSNLSLGLVLLGEKV